MKKRAIFLPESDSDSPDVPSESQPVAVQKKVRSKKTTSVSAVDPKKPLPSSTHSNEERANKTPSKKNAKITKHSKPALKVSEKRKRKSKKHDSDNEEVLEEAIDSYSSEDTEEEFNDGYDDNFMGNEEDRARLASMTEIEREQELFKRVEAREAMRTRFNIEKKLKRAERESQKQKTKKLDKKYDRPLSDSKRNVQERKKTVGEKRGKDDKKSSLDLLKAPREEKKGKDKKKKQHKGEVEEEEGEGKGGKVQKKCSKKQEREKDRKHKRRSGASTKHKTPLKTSEVYSDNSSTSEADDSKSEKVDLSESGLAVQNIKCIETVEEANAICISRFRIEQFLRLPNFKTLITGCFVRVLVGVDGVIRVYKPGMITEVGEASSEYLVGSTKTNCNIKVNYGIEERFFFLLYVSDEDITESEFMLYKRVCAKDGVPMPTVNQFNEKLKDLKEAALSAFTKQDVEKLVNEKETLQTDPVKYAAKKTELIKRRDMYKLLFHLEEAHRIQKELEKLEKEEKESMRKKASVISSINYVIDRNRKKNLEEAAKAAT